MCLLKLQMHKHGNSIYFTHDNMVCFPKFGHIYHLFNHIKDILRKVAWCCTTLLLFRETPGYEKNYVSKIRDRGPTIPYDVLNVHRELCQDRDK